MKVTRLLYSNLVDWIVNREVKNTAEECKNPNLQLKIGSFRNLQQHFSFSGSPFMHQSIF